MGKASGIKLKLAARESANPCHKARLTRNHAIAERKNCLGLGKKD
jgi:hypothetical protein